MQALRWKKEVERSGDTMAAGVAGRGSCVENHCGGEGTCVSMELRGRRQSPRLGSWLTGPTLQGLLNSEGEPTPYGGAKGRLCVEG